jgi:muramoyltetrapeptide carboxypeptidase
MQYIAPKRLRPGNRVAIVAPSSPFMTDEVNAGIDVIREMGLVPVLGPCVKNLHTRTIHAASTAERVNELNWAFADPKINGVVGVCGGEGSAEVLPYLDYDMIRRTCKVFVGMSDLTAINTGILTQAGLITINGQTPSIRLNKGFKIQEADTLSWRKTLELLMSDAPWGNRPFQINPYFPRTVSKGRSSGHAIGGNMDTFVHLLGTPYMCDFDGSILFIEGVHDGGEEVARQILHLKLAGVISRVSGIVVGEFVDVPKKEDPKVPSIEDVIIEYLGEGAPCSYGYSFSHGPHTSPIPVGAACLLDADSGDVSFDFCMAT